MTEATDTGPDLFPLGDFAGSGFAVGPLFGGEQSEAILMMLACMLLGLVWTMWMTGMTQQ